MGGGGSAGRKKNNNCLEHGTEQERGNMVSHFPQRFSAVARRLQEHVAEAEDRCSAFENQCDAAGFRASVRGDDSVAAARWWWREVIERIYSSRFMCMSPVCRSPSFDVVGGLWYRKMLETPNSNLLPTSVRYI